MREGDQQEALTVEGAVSIKIDLPSDAPPYGRSDIDQVHALPDGREMRIRAIVTIEPANTATLTSHGEGDEARREALLDALRGFSCPDCEHFFVDVSWSGCESCGALHDLLLNEPSPPAPPHLLQDEQGREWGVMVALAQLVQSHDSAHQSDDLLKRRLAGKMHNQERARLNALLAGRAALRAMKGEEG